MSTATKRVFHRSVVAGAPGSDTLDNWSFEYVTAATLPAAGTKGQMVYLEDMERIASYGLVSSKWVIYRTNLDDELFQSGGHDASAGIPTTALDAMGNARDILAGDRWRVTVAGSITGIVNGPEIQVGDIITAVTNGAAAATDFLVEEANQQGIAVKGNVLTGQVLAADTPLSLVFPDLTDLYGLTVIDEATGDVLESEVVDNITGNTAIISASVGFTVTVKAIGVA